MSDVLGLRLRDDEWQLLERAAELEAQPGDRGGMSTWVRRVALREAQLVVEAAAEREAADKRAAERKGEKAQ